MGSLKELLEVADVVLLHVPLKSFTRNMISLTELKRMKPTAILINTARGGIVNEKDLAQALEERLIFGAGIDVHEVEPPTQERHGGLWNSGTKNIVSLPHVGAMTKDTQVATGKAAIDGLHRYITEQTS